jgi:hypothetical protein
VTRPSVDLVFDEGCPNVGEARVLLGAALAAAALPVEWRECGEDHREGGYAA